MLGLLHEMVGGGHIGIKDREQVCVGVGGWSWGKGRRVVWAKKAAAAAMWGSFMHGSWIAKQMGRVLMAEAVLERLAVSFKKP